MLLRHYLEQGASKSALARQLGISQHDLPVDPVGRSRPGSRHQRRAVWAAAAAAHETRRLQSDHRDAPGGLSRAVGRAPAGRNSGRRLRRGLPFEFAGDRAGAIAQYGAAIVDRVDFDTGRVRPSLSWDVSLGVIVAKTPTRSLRVQADGAISRTSSRSSTSRGCSREPLWRRRAALPFGSAPISRRRSRNDARTGFQHRSRLARSRIGDTGASDATELMVLHGCHRSSCRNAR